MWTAEKTKHVDGIITRLSKARHKDELGDALFQVETETGYEVEFIYDIFTEAVIDEEVNPERAPRSVLQEIWESVITPAYEFDY